MKGKEKLTVHLISDATRDQYLQVKGGNQSSLSQLSLSPYWLWCQWHARFSSIFFFLFWANSPLISSRHIWPHSARQWPFKNEMLVGVVATLSHHRLYHFCSWPDRSLQAFKSIVPCAFCMCICMFPSVAYTHFHHWSTQCASLCQSVCD